MSYQDRHYREDSDQGSSDALRHVRRLLTMSFPGGTFLDIRVRVHVAFVLVPIFLLTWGVPWLPCLLLTAVLYLSVLLHEFGHCLACRWQGGRADEVLMGPIGGVAFTQPPDFPRAHMVTTAAGPAVNLALGMVAYGLARFVFGLAVFADGILSPFQTVGYEAGTLMAMVATVNLFLGAINLLLLFLPYDGGRLICEAIWAATDARRGKIYGCRAGMVMATLTFLLSLAWGSIFFAILAALGFVTCYQESQIARQQEAEEPWASEVWLEPQAPARKPAWWTRRREARAARRAAAARQTAMRLEREVDQILDKVRMRGMASLTRSERRTLEQATEAKRRVK